MAEAPSDELEPRVAWIARLLQGTFRSVKSDRLKRFLGADESLGRITEFLDSRETLLILFTEVRGDLQVHLAPPRSTDRSSWLWLLKLEHDVVDRENIHNQVLYGDLHVNPLEHLMQLMRHVYLPVLLNRENQVGWSELVSKEVSENIHRFLANTQITVGNTKGETCLPLPPEPASAAADAEADLQQGGDGGEAGEGGDGDGPQQHDDAVASRFVAHKERVHVLESALITWTKQIKAVLRLEPEQLMERLEHPGPIEELKFWGSKASNLNSIFDQLQGEPIRRVLRFLDQSKSTYNSPFAKLCKEVFQARAEANDNYRLLRPLQPWFERLDEEPEFERLTDVFRPMMHLVLLVWKSSRFYNTQARLVVLIREICNSIIRQACGFLSGERVFALIEQEETRQAIDMLRTTLRVCGTFKTTYFDYKAKASAECPKNAWKMNNAALFVRLDSFLERCHDILDLTQTIMQFSKLAKIEVGGTKGKTLTTSVQQIYSDFLAAVAQVRNVGYDVMNLDAKQFEDDFYEFRSRIKELERRLGSVVMQGFDDAVSVTARFKLLDSFEGLLERPIIQDELEKKHLALLVSYGEDLTQVQALFLEYRDDPPISHNLPPIAGALSWCRGLLERVRLPMEKLKALNRAVMEREEAKEVVKVYSALVASLAEFEHSKIEAWGQSIESSSQAKLKNPLLRREGADALLHVNFDALLVRLLREVKYFLLLGLQVPDNALQIYRKAEVFRRQTGNLDLIVNMYNTIQTTLLPVERPLVKAQLDKIDRALAQGVGGAGGGRKLNWKSHGIDLFLTESMAEVREASNILATMKNNLKHVEETLAQWSLEPLMDRRSKPAQSDEFEELNGTVRQARYALIREGGNEIHRLLKDTNKKLKVSQGLPDWKAYVDFVNNIVVAGLVNVVIVSLEFLVDQIDPALIEREDKMPILEIEIDLLGRDVVFSPAVDAAEEGIEGLVHHWIDRFMHVGCVFRRLDINEGNYLKELQEDPRVQLLVAQVHEHLARCQDHCHAYRDNFSQYSYLWTSDLNALFADFVNTAILRPRAGLVLGDASGVGADEDDSAAEDSGAEDDGVLPTVAAQIQARNPDMPPLLDLQRFDERIQHFLSVQAEIAELKHSTDLDFLRVNAQPIKQALSTWVTKWVYLYTQYLHDYVVDELRRLAAFMDTVNDGLDLDVPQGDKDSLMAVMTHIRDVRKRMDATQLMFVPLRDTTSLLKSHGISIELTEVAGVPAVNFLEQAPMLWDNTVNKTFKRKEVIQPLQNQMVDTIKRDVGAFHDRVAIFRKEFLKGAPFSSGGSSNAITVAQQHYHDRLSGLAAAAPAAAATDHDDDAAASASDADAPAPAAASHSTGGGVSRGTLPDQAYSLLDNFQRRLGGTQQEARAFTDLEELFELATSRYEELEETEAQLKLLKMAWDMVALIAGLFSHWQRTLWNEIDTDELLTQTKRLLRDVKALPALMREWELYDDIKDSVQNMATLMPLVQELHSPAMRDRHWKSLILITHKHFEKGPLFCLQDVLELELHNHVDEVMETVEVATKELKIEVKLRNIEESWTGLMLDFARYKDTDVRVLTQPDDIVEMLEEHQLQLQTMSGMGKFVDYFRDRVEQWQQRLGNVETTLKLWLTVQKQWSSLESIFLGSADIRAQLPDDTKRFEGIDVEFKELMAAVMHAPGVIEACTADGRELVLQDMHGELQRCQKALNEYLDMKKNIFPRFYFVSNVALLDILANGNVPAKIMPHLGSVFDAVDNLDLKVPDQPKTNKGGGGDDEDDEDDDGGADGGGGGEGGRKFVPVANTATHMISKDGERVQLASEFLMTGAVETWLSDLVGMMRTTLKNVLDISLETAAQWEVDKPRHEWLVDYPAQLVLLASQVLWTEEVEVSLEELENGSEDAVRSYRDVCTSRLEALIQVVLGELTPQERTKVITLITIDVHARDVVNALIDKKVETSLDFAWQQQLRYYWDEANLDVNIRICDFRSTYSYEYIGNCGRLVITPLTDRCYVTLTTALRLYLGGAPAGPAGTGKTETTKDLARCMGLPCYVFNCSDQMNYQTMADIFRGLSQTGAWGCFDEFNRIPIEVLSVVATQVKTVLDAIVYLAVPANRPQQYAALPAGTPPVRVGNFDFFGETIVLVPTTGFFITMNPGYAGRTELPENLKALFRSCAMIRPDLKPICENMLMAEGFQRARPLAIKFVTLYELSAELLSKQPHYDWGLRAVKSVLRVAGMLKRAADARNLDEELVLMRALRDFNTPKIPAHDLQIFLRLIADLFPGLSPQVKVNEDLKAKCAAVCPDMGLQPEDGFVAKVVQFHELLAIRHSVMLLGAAGSGKTTIWKTLAACLNVGAPKAVAVYETVNPKAVTSDELYGHMTLAKDWKDGVLSIIMRNMSKGWAPYSELQTSKWVVLDGDIDAVWIESMNTVMDDNKVLTLVSNERIPLSDAMRMVFEIDSLKNATPATVSRAGILYINEADIGWRPFVDSWVAAQRTPRVRDVLTSLFARYAERILELMRLNKLVSVVPVPAISMLVTLCNILDGVLATLDEAAKTPEALEGHFVYAAIWAFGGHLVSDKTGDSRRQFSVIWSGEFRSHCKLPEAGLVYDYVYDHVEAAWVPWASRVPEWVPVGEPQYSTLVVPTVDSVRHTHLMRRLVANRNPVLFVGAAGTGKTSLVKEFLNNLEDDLHCAINMNYYTDAAALQHQLEAPIDKRSGKAFGPPSGKRMIYFVDDLNMPFVEEYGTQTPIALLRQHMDYNGWYDRHDLGLKKEIQDVQFIACMNPTAGSFLINPRLQRHFATVCLQIPDAQALMGVYSSVLTNHLANFPMAVQQLVPKVTEAMVVLHQGVTERFLPSAVKFHYNFNMRDLAAVMQGLCLSQAEYFARPLKLVRLWLHESYRVFSDRLVSDTEIVRFHDMIVDISKRYFEEDQSELHAQPLVFTNFATPTIGDSPAYLPVTDAQQLREVLVAKLVEYNEANPAMDLVLFEEAMAHVARISRIIANPRGSALLVGVGGSGKQSLARLASFIQGYDVVQISVTSTFGVNDLKEALKDLYRKAGVKPGLPISFILTDGQVTDERFLVYINDLLSSGYIPDLFNKDEYDGIFTSLRNEAKAAGVSDSRDSMLDFFVGRVRANLHLVLCFSPVGDLFRVRARKFPALINCTAIDWFHPWPRDALVSVASSFLAELDLGADEVRENVAHHMAEVHLSVTAASVQYRKVQRRHNYTTPKSFLELISFYKGLLTSKRREFGRQVERLDVGLSTLRNTAAVVEKLQEDLKVTLKKVDERKRATEALLEQMGNQRGEAEAQQIVADEERVKANSAAEDARRIEEAAARELEVAKPAMDRAREAVNCLNKASLTELKSMTKPPAGVDKVTTAVLMMVKGERRNFRWDNAKKMMAKVDAFKAQLETYRGEDIPEDVVALVDPILQDPNFTYDKMKSKSSAAANLCNWVINIIAYNRIYVRVKPLMDRLDEARAVKTAAEAELAAVEAQLAEIEQQLQELQHSFLEATNEKAKVEAEAASCQGRLSLAERLVNGLSSENERWGSEIDRLRAQEVMLVGDTLLSAAFVSYIGAFDAVNREDLWRAKWIPDLYSREIPLTEDLEPLSILTNDASVAEWQNEGLPADRMSTENGAIITNCQRWPLLIDPQLQGLKWLRAREQDNGLAVLQTSRDGWMRDVEQAIQNGTPVIIENLGETIDAVLDPVLMRAVSRKGRNSFIRLGGEEMLYDPNFRLYLQTKMPNPHYKPEIAAQCTLINFIVTERGLEDQLLAKVVNAEQPQLEADKTALQQAFNRYKIQLLDLEDQLLERLANAPEDILSDVPLIEGLEATKIKATEINEAVTQGKDTERVLNVAREVYRTVAKEASMLYFILITLHRMNNMYEYSLDSFVTVFHQSIRDAPEEKDQTTRIEFLRVSLRKTVFTWVSRGLFNNHILVFLAQMTMRLMELELVGAKSGFRADFLQFLLRGPRLSGEESTVEWLPESTFNALASLVELEGFEGFLNDMEENGPRFQEWYNHATPESEKLPMDWRELDKKPFLKLLVVRCLRPDRMTVALTNFIRDTLPSGEAFTECDAHLSFYQIIEESFVSSTPTTPIYFVLSAGADVVADLDRLASTHGRVRGLNYHNIALGQGQDVVAMQRLQAAHREGHWVVLNNVHLMPRWLVQLEKLLDRFADEGSHEDFRLFLSSDPAPDIPVGLLNRSIKLTNEPPSGLKANVKRAWSSFDPAETEELEPRTRGILFGLCYFHGIMIERRKFAAAGFNMHYPFAAGDLVCSASVLRNYMENAPSRVPWTDLRYLFGEIMYGGHIVNDFDRLVCTRYLEFFLRDELLDEMPLFPHMAHIDTSVFIAPSISNSHERVVAHIDEELRGDTPLAFGMHPNAEIGFRTAAADTLFATMIELQPREAQGQEGTQSSQHVAESMLQDILDMYRGVAIDMDELRQNIDELGPFQNVFLQECERMNTLLGEIVRSLVELDMGFRGDLTMSDAMESLSEALVLDKVPDSWARLAFASQRPLGGWLTNLGDRLAQLQEWVQTPMDIPFVTWLPGLFNPQSFLTAILQVTAQRSGLELDKLLVQTEVTKRMYEAIDAPSRDGAYIYGLALEGARWDANTSTLENSEPREMTCELPVINCRAVQNLDASPWYACPVYQTQQRGPTYVFSLQLRSKFPASKWTLAGVVAVLDVSGKA